MTRAGDRGKQSKGRVRGGIGAWERQGWHPVRLWGLLKALVWFWLIDETLSASLVYQDDYEIGSTTPCDEANEDHGMTMMMA